MGLFSKQPWFCNACGKEQNSIPFPPGAVYGGGKYTCCSRDCADEMNWRYTLAIMGHEYQPRTKKAETGNET